MNIIVLICRQHPAAFALMLLLTLLSGGLGIGILAYINHYLLGGHGREAWALGLFLLLVLLYLASATWAQIVLARIGHGFVYTMQADLVKRILDTPQARLQLIGKPRLLASLGNDIRTLSIAFARLPELVQGLLFVIACSLYLLWLSTQLFALIAGLLAAMMALSHWAVQRHYHYFAAKRRGEDILYRHYQTTLDGHKELALNRYRAERLFRHDFLPAAAQKRDDHVRADAYHVFALNWGNSVMLAIVGLVFYLALYHQWASAAEAAVISMTVLFMRAPLLSVIGSLPTLMQSRVALEVLDGFALPPTNSDFHAGEMLPPNWQTIRLQDVGYHYPEQGGRTFRLHPVNLTLHRGECVFLVGGNGSGKSTLSMLLCGLYPPSSGQIWLDNIPITEPRLDRYRQLFASVFTEFYLFDRLLDGHGDDAEAEQIDTWLARLQLSDKVRIQAGQILNPQLSQGQRKRLGLMLAALENRSLLILDEWAADQDPHFRRLFYEQLLPLLRAEGATIFAISHDDQYFHHADRILEMRDGHLQPYRGHAATT